MITILCQRLRNTGLHAHLILQQPVQFGTGEVNEAAVYLGLSLISSVACLSTAEPPSNNSIWIPPQAGMDLQWTWLQIVSDEWLKGEIIDMRDGTLEFDSDELDEVGIDWEDVKAIITKRPHTVALWNRATYTGALHQAHGKVIVTDADGAEYILNQEDVQSLVDGRPTERNFWSGTVSLGFTTRSGNSEQVDASALIKIDRRAIATRWLNSYNATVSTVAGDKTAENQRFNSNFDWFLTPRLFVTPLFYEFFETLFKNISSRHSPGLGLGYDPSIPRR